MIFYQQETLSSLLIASLPAVLSAYFCYIKGNNKAALALLILSAFLLRILMVSLDPYVHEWDERHHALVAKNMIDHPFSPMLFTRHIIEFNPLDVGMLKIWVHKQPLFLWQMAISMKVLGVSTFALRLPSAIMGTIMVWMTYDMGRKWTQNYTVAYIAAFLSTFAYYALELISGWMSLDHNDLAFTFYSTCCFWGFTRYIHSDFKVKWAIWIGIFSGLAILNKWLTGLLIFGGWGLYLLMLGRQITTSKWVHLGLALLITCAVFLPWQIYIREAFPAESAISFEFNRRHMTEDLAHPGNAFFHLAYLPTAYHLYLLPFLILGMVTIFFSKNSEKKLTISFLAMILVIFSFFSLFVKTKMPAFVYPVSSLIFIFMAYGFYFISSFLLDYIKMNQSHRNLLFAFTTLIVGFLSFKPGLIAEHRSEKDQMRNNKITNSTLFKNMDNEIVQNYVILNTRAYENLELMFYKGGTSYHWYPPESILDSLQTFGHKFAAFDYSNDPQQLPEYIKNDKSIIILKEPLK